LSETVQLRSSGSSFIRISAEKESLRNFGSLAARLNNPDITNLLPDFPLLSAYIWAWRDISGNKVVGEWVDSMTGEDEAFLKLLLQLRYHGTSSEDGNYWALKLSDMALLLGDRDKIE